jgi:uncharacterized protein YecT (DUF1311 family)
VLACLVVLSAAQAAAQEAPDCAAPADAAAAVACAATALRMADEDMDLAYGMAVARAEALSAAGVADAPALLAASQGAWTAMRQTACTLEAALVRGDPVEPALIDQCSERMARARTEDLRRFGEVN